MVVCMSSISIYARYEQVTLGTVSWSGYTEWSESSQEFSNAYIESKLLEKARSVYPGYTNYYVTIVQNNKQHESKGAPYTKTGDPYLDGYNSAKMLFRYKYTATGQVYAQKWVEDPKPVVVIQNSAPASTTPRSRKSQELNFEEALSSAIEKALEDVSEGSRIAFNKIITPTNIPKSQVKDQILEALLDNNFKVVAKEYFETIKDELEEQRSGQYSERTKVKENNLSASGYLLDCKIDSDVIKIYIISVSTGEYKSTSKVNYN